MYIQRRNLDKYYSDKLSARKLQLCYAIAPPRIQQYLEAEIQYVLDKIQPCDFILELGCGYGRILSRIWEKSKVAIGIDTSESSLELGVDLLHGSSNCHLIQMDAAAMAFRDRVFDLVACPQNGLSAFKVDPFNVIREGIRVTRPGGRVMLSSYSERFWSDRLEWFSLQADKGLLGEIDWNATGEGVIVCKDGFHATTFSEADFIALTSRIGVEPVITEVDGSSLFCEITIPKLN